MQVLTVLVAALLLSNPPDPFGIRESATLELARSKATFPAVYNVRIQVSRKEILVDNRRAAYVACKFRGRPCMDADLGKQGVSLSIDPVNKEHGRRESLLIIPLKELLDQAVKEVKEPNLVPPEEIRRKYMANQGVVTIICDRSIPYRMIAEIVYTAAVAELHDIRFAVRPEHPRTPRQINTQRVIAPRRNAGPRKGREHKEHKPLNLTVLIKKGKGFQLSWENRLMTDTHTAPILPMVRGKVLHCSHQSKRGKNTREPGCMARGGGCQCYDFAGLYNELVKIKTRYKPAGAGFEETRINIAADVDVPWEVVSRTMDAATCMLEAPTYATFGEWAFAKPKKGELAKVPGLDEPVRMCEALFPQVVFTIAE